MKLINKKDFQSGKTVFSFAIAFCFAVLIYFLLTVALFTSISTFVENLQLFWWKHVLLVLLVTAIIISVYIAGLTAKPDWGEYKVQMFISFSILLAIAVCTLTDLYFSAFARPLALCGIFVAIGLNKRTAIFSLLATSLIYALIEGYVIGFSTEVTIPMLFGFLSGTIMIMLLAENDTRIKTVYTILVMVPMYAILSIISNLIYSNGDGQVLINVALQSILSPILSGFLYLGILPVYEALFKLITPYYLTEITDESKGLLAKLHLEAAGTFNHSIAIANLVAPCALAIGEDPRLARACAYYHDVGKLNKPNLFVENQEGEENPHDKITPELSVKLIKDHVSQGVEMLEKNNFPEEIVAAAAEHHGTMEIGFFYKKAMSMNDGTVDPKEYSYDGPKPKSKITAMIMIGDACEAATRATSDRSREKIDDIVTNVIETRMDAGQFDDCNITFRDLQTIRTIMVDNLAGLYHKRIQYPKLHVRKRKNTLD